MSVRPVSFNADGSVGVVHDDVAGPAHVGTVALVDLRFGRDVDGSVDLDVIEVTCPEAGCGFVSSHPIGGGAAAAAVQKMFARVVLRRAVALGIPVGQRTWPAIRARVVARIAAAEGPARVRIAGMATEDDGPTE